VVAGALQDFIFDCTTGMGRAATLWLRAAMLWLHEPRHCPGPDRSRQDRRAMRLAMTAMVR
jgi:hypothetical protein